MSFQKASSSKNAVKQIKLSGVKPWLNGCHLISTGQKDFDQIQGGGMPLGSIVLLVKDRYTNYSQVLIKYFISEGLSSKQKVFYTSNEKETYQKEFIKNLPENSTLMSQSTPAKAEEKSDVDSTLQIAWQYKKYLTKTNNPTQFCNSYNLSHQIQPELLESAQLHYYTFEETNTIKSLYHQIKSQIEDNTIVTRIIIRNLELLLIDNMNDFITFVISLHSLIFNKPTVVLIELDQNIISSNQVLNSIENQCDGVFHIESFACTDIKKRNPEFGDCDGAFRIIRLSHPNSLSTPPLKANIYGIKCGIKQLRLELLHLPPEDSRTSAPIVNCKSKCDF